MLPVLLCLPSTCDRSELCAVLTLRDKSSDFCSFVASVSRERSTSGIEAPQNIKKAIKAGRRHEAWLREHFSKCADSLDSAGLEPWIRLSQLILEWGWTSARSAVVWCAVWGHDAGLIAWPIKYPAGWRISETFFSAACRWLLSKRSVRNCSESIYYFIFELFKVTPPLSLYTNIVEDAAIFFCLNKCYWILKAGKEMNQQTCSSTRRREKRRWWVLMQFMVIWYS